MKHLPSGLFALAAAGIAACVPFSAALAQAPAANPAPQTKAEKDVKSPIVTMRTDKGIIKIKLYPDVTPNTVNSFLTLVNKGFYNGLTFHRVEPGFVIQGGDPQGTGRGGPGYEIKNEDNKKLKHNVGAVAMANAGPDTAGSQFYIVISKPADFLDAKDDRGISKYTIFGQVISGQDVAEHIAVGDKMTSVSAQLPKGFKVKPPVTTKAN